MLLSTISRCSGFSCQPLSTSDAGQPVEQLGMAGPLAVEAEVVGRLDEARAEMVLPERG